MFFLPLIISAAIYLSILMGITWYYAEKNKNAGLVDVLWAFSFTGIVLIYDVSSNTPWDRKGILSIMVILWSARLTMHLHSRYQKNPTEEDARYHALRERWGGSAKKKFFWFFQFQGLFALLLSSPFLLIQTNWEESFHSLEWLGVVIWLFGFIGEATADQQLTVFKAKPENRGAVCNVGLWKFSRHPNYFFEFVIWIGLALFAFPSRFGWIAISAPLLILVTLLFFSGIPPAEAQALKTKGEKYEAYRRITSVFFPWPPKLG